MWSFPRFPLSALLAGLCGLVLNGCAARPPATVVTGSRPFVNHGLVGVGRMPSDMKDKFGETFGSFSAMAFAPGSWKREADGSYSGTLFTQPDRGYNVTGTTNYNARTNKLTVAFLPALPGIPGAQLRLTLADTLPLTEADGTPLTALDPTASGAGSRPGFPPLPQAYNGRLSIDAEGLAIQRDGTFWISDEYGPYLYKFSPAGKLLAAIRPPEALIPKRNGADSFASANPASGQPKVEPADPSTGRQNNQGLEGLSLSPDGKTLFALLQSATRQDGGTGSSGPRRHSRLLAYDLSQPAAPVLKGEYIVPLPTYLEKGVSRVAAQSELQAIDDTRFLVLARDGNGRNAASPVSVYRSIVVYDISEASNIAETPYDSPTTPITPNGELLAAIKPAAATPFIDMNDPAELAKFGLNNGPTSDSNTLSEKWESMALVPTLDPANPNDWFLFVGNDNDFATTRGYQVGAAYKADLDNDSMILVYRLTLPPRR